MKAEIIRGVSAMTIRQLLGICMNAAGMLVVTRILGPGQFGVFGGAYRVYFVVWALFQLGTPVYLVKTDPDSKPDTGLLGTATLTLAFMGLLGALFTTACSPLMTAWTRAPQLTTATVLMAWFLPLTLGALVPQALLERQLAFPQIAKAELFASVINYAVSIPMALVLRSAWSLVLGWMAQQLALTLALHIMAGHRPTLAWNRTQARELWRFGWRYGISIAVWQLRNLSVPLIVSRYAGPVGLGYVSLIQRMVDLISFPRIVAARLSISIFSKARAANRELAGMLESAMIAQTLLVGALAVIIGAYGGRAVEALFGGNWTAAIVIFRPLAIVALVNCAFHLTCSAMYVYNRADLVNWYNIASTLLVVPCSLLLTSKYGVQGYAASELISLLAYVPLLVLAKRELSLPYPTAGLVWLLAGAGAVAASDFGPASIGIFALPLLLSSGRERARSLIAAVSRSGFRHATN